MTLRDDTTRELHRIALDRQRKGRRARALRRGRPGRRAGLARGHRCRRPRRPGPRPATDHQFLIASNTKTFTAVMVMQLRDEGRLSLDDTLDTFVPEVSPAGLTIRQCLAHVSGMQREPLGDVWETLDNPDRAELVSGFNAGRAGAPRRTGVWHYSNLVLLDARRGRRPPRRPRLGRVPAGPDPRPAGDAPHHGRVRRPARAGLLRAAVHRRTRPQEPPLDLRALDPCGGLASTGADLARWSAFVADPVGRGARSRDTVEEMCQPQIVIDRERWTAAMGLGFFLVRSGTRTYVGHTGGMPGHITARLHRPRGRHRGVVLTNSGSTPDIAGFAIALADHVTEHEPVEPEPWRPGTVVPAELADLIGVWYSEGSPFTFSVREGRLEARAAGAARAQAVLALRAGRARPVPHRRRPRGRRAAAGHPRRRRAGHAAELGDVPRHPGARSPSASGPDPGGTPGCRAPG